MNELFARIPARIKKYRSRTNKNGFSLLEAVVVVGVMLALAVGGFVAYDQTIGNARKASVDSAASSVYMAVLAAKMDGNAATDPSAIEDEYNDSQDAISVTITGLE